MARRSARAWGARLAAPAAFLLAVTIAVLLVRSALRDDDGGAKTVSVSTRAATAPATRTTTTAKKRRPPTQRKRYYVIESGDTFGTVAAQFGTTVAALQALNPDASSNALVIGQRIRVR